MSRRTMALLGLAVLVGIGAALFRVWVYQDTVQLGYRLSEHEDERRRLRNEVRQLEIELAAERSPARLAEIAHGLGLEPVPPRQLAPPSRRVRLQAQAPVDAGRAQPSGGRHGQP